MLVGTHAAALLSKAKLSFRFEQLSIIMSKLLP